MDGENEFKCLKKLPALLPCKTAKQALLIHVDIQCI